MIDHKCQGCGKDFQSDGRRNKYCSQKCYHDHRKGESHPRYKGGTINHSGYRVICINGKQLFEHRHLMSLKLGRPLLAHEQVHHIDGNPANNGLSNLVLTSSSEHMTRYHSSLHHDEEKHECCRCHQVKLNAEFNKGQKICRVCQHEYYVTYYAKKEAAKIGARG